MRKIFFILFLLLTSNLSAYDYSWHVEYEIKRDSLERINKIVSDFIYDHPEFQVYKVDYTTYEVGTKTDDYKLLLGTDEWIPFGQVLEAKIYLDDVDAVINFYVPYVAGYNLIRLVSYCTDLKQVGDDPQRKKWGKYTSFNDVEPTKKEIPIKESFEKNFLSKLDLEWEYVKPAALDRGLSKFLSLFRKRKNFPDD